jgi:hypothetical protein
LNVAAVAVVETGLQTVVAAAPSLRSLPLRAVVVDPGGPMEVVELRGVGLVEEAVAALCKRRSSRMSLLMAVHPG